MKPVNINDISIENEERYLTELKRWIGTGRGIVRGSLVLVGGDPGIGKSLDIDMIL